MKSSKHIRSWIIKTLLSENQAIGIYEAEVYWKKYPQEAFSIILRDEKDHFCKMEEYLKDNAWNYSSFNKLEVYLYQFSGWIIGTILSLLPRKLCFYFHAVAENKAAVEYENLAEEMSKVNELEVKQHSRFQKLLLGMMDSEFAHAEIFKFHNNLIHR